MCGITNLTMPTTHGVLVRLLDVCRANAWESVHVQDSHVSGVTLLEIAQTYHMATQGAAMEV